MGVTVLYGGAFDPPHLGHVAVADAARERFGVERLVILVGERPAHRETHASADDRLAMARAAFPQDDVRLDPHPRTVELLRAEQFDDPVFVIGADQFAGFGAWAEPDEVLAMTRLAVVTRPGVPGLPERDRVVWIEMPPVPISATVVRAKAAAGESLDALVPPAVAALIAERGLYRP